MVALCPIEVIDHCACRIGNVRGLREITSVQTDLSKVSKSLLVTRSGLPSKISRGLLFKNRATGGRVGNNFCAFNCYRDVTSSRIFGLCLGDEGNGICILRRSISTRIRSMPMGNRVNSIRLVVGFGFAIPSGGGSKKNKGNNGGADNNTNFSMKISS